ncbi:hypothetical protein V6N12_002751 [Hibiscus sabdariffa]|uniref:Uncharacterized protein n=1 Tax=Hibiscus sabdariffa TaxID=183260 RepID=A0ABR2EC07_9ROSI
MEVTVLGHEPSRSPIDPVQVRMKCQGSVSGTSSVPVALSASVFKSASFPDMSRPDLHTSNEHSGSASGVSRMQPNLTDVCANSELNQPTTGVGAEQDLSENAGVVSPVVEESVGRTEEAVPVLVPAEIQSEALINVDAQAVVSNGVTNDTTIVPVEAQSMCEEYDANSVGHLAKSRADGHNSGHLK